ncbi:hypothetical protein MUB18_06570 [Sphingobacterium sp. PCS056]|jgi:hypothetical protein|uniref:hypothetical protein n=1 Tax=Sphingobacterium TaxID=28453 RepID=UPI00097E84AB|nr:MULTISPECIES: hypothetical protein [Sphingobacterium]PTX12583.1 hypothetical protein C8N37_102278 [Sphingobacterium faecium]UPZ37960.1 hypothetical protein MUB18_06570 [Sphingobacterium sp. PCS056]GEM62290.1 hypothetical protein SF1_02720 [Sphingobacterium faecium NBRC 15299]SJN51104.1 hypothetical protein FM120_28965 [Sphingobacterium faecium PCAi_F2.5]
MKNRFVKKLKKMDGLPLSIYFLEKDNSVAEKGVLKMDAVQQINSKGSLLVNYYKPISKL